MEPHHDETKGSCVPNRASPKVFSKSRVRRVAFWTPVVLAALFFASSISFQSVRAQEREPIAATGHGGFFDHDGRQIPVNLEFIAKPRPGTATGFWKI